MKVTILTASRNCSKYIEECINSVLVQTYKEWDMLILDDCSKDNTFDIVSKFSNTHHSIKSFKNDSRLYCGSTYSKLSKMATGDICAVLDGDDKIIPEAIETLVYFYEKYKNVDFIWTNHKWFNSRMDRVRSGISSPPLKGTIYGTEEGFKHVYSHWRTFRTYLREKKDLFRSGLQCAVDKDLGYTLEEVGRGGFINIPLYHYRYHPENMSHKTNQKESWKDIRRLHKNIPRYKSLILSK